MNTLLTSLNQFSPLGIAALALAILGMTIRLLLEQRRLMTNHMHLLPEMHETLKRVEVVLREHISMEMENQAAIREALSYLKASLRKS